MIDTLPYTSTIPFYKYVTNIHLFDLVVLVGPIGVFFGRVANFINGELVGRVAPDNAWFKVKFPTEMAEWNEPSKFAKLEPVVEKVGVEKAQYIEWVQNYGSSVAARRSINETVNKLILAVQEGNEQVKTLLFDIIPSRYPSQLYAAMTEGIFVFLALWLYWKKPRKSGVVGAAFLVVYGLARIANEQFRRPDLHLGYQLLGLTRGQWLSVGMVVIGIVLVAIWQKRNAEPVGGWGEPAKPQS